MTYDPNDPALIAAVQTILANMLPTALQAALGAQGTAPAPFVQPNSVRAQTRPPARDAITLAQFTLLNNAVDGPKKKYEQQFKMALEIWTEPLATISLSDPQWKRNSP